MRKYILICIAASLYYSGLVALARVYTRLRGQRLIILNYHQASAGNLERQLLYLRRFYHILPVEKALEELYSSPPLSLSSSKRATLLALTFDDGYYDNYSHAFPLAKRLQVPLTFYLIPGYIGETKRFWWQEGKQLVTCSQVATLSYEGQHFDLRKAKGKKALAHFINARLRFSSSIEEREAFLCQMRLKLAISGEVTDREQAHLTLSWEQIQEMEQSGWISFGAHTMHHPILACLADQKEIQYEVQECRYTLEKQLGHEVSSFAYPVGQLQHFDSRTLHAVQKAGYRWALTTNYGINTPQSYPYQLKRIEVDVCQHWLIVACEAAGLWGFFSRLRWNAFVRQYWTNAPSAR